MNEKRVSDSHTHCEVIMALWQLFLGINHEEFARMVFGFEQDKINFCWFVSCGCGSSSFLETGNNRFHRMLGGIIIQPTLLEPGGH